MSRKSKWMEITTVISCQNFCSYCPQQTLIDRYGETRRKGEHMSLETFEACLDKIPANYELHFSGYAEPFQNPLCMDMIRLAVARQRTMQLYTTLRFVNHEMFQELRNIRFKKVVIHLPDADMNWKPESDFYEILELIVSGQGFNCRKFEFVSLIDNVDEKTREILTDDRIRYSKQISRAGNLGEWIQHGGKVYCSRSRSLEQNVLIPDGRVQVCCCDYGLDHTMGNLLEDNLDNMSVDPTELCLKCEFARKVK